MFKIGDVVEWCGSLGIVSNTFRGVIYCDFYYQEGPSVKKEMVWFFADGKLRQYHQIGSLKLASPEQSIDFRRYPIKLRDDAAKRK